MIFDKWQRNTPIKYEKEYSATFQTEAGGPYVTIATTGKDIPHVRGRIKKAFPKIVNLKIRSAK